MTTDAIPEVIPTIAEPIRKSIPNKPLSRRSIIRRNRAIHTEDQRSLGEEKVKREDAEKNALTDRLTGTKSRLWYDQQLEAKMNLANRYKNRGGRNFYIAVYDLDLLKGLNDYYGTVGADKILKNMGRLTPRSGEDIARVGGDEFAQLINSNVEETEVLTMMRRNADDFLTLGDQLLPALTPKKNRPSNSVPAQHTTLSVGLIRYIPGMTSEQLKSLSDEVLAEAKKSRDSIAISRDGKTIEVVERHPAPQPVPIQS